MTGLIMAAGLVFCVWMLEMVDNQLYKELIQVIKNGLLQYGINAAVKQANQPTQQGAESAPTIYLTKIFDKRYGFVQREEFWNLEKGMFDHREIQQYESTFQANAFSTQSTGINSVTASDLANYAAGVLQSDFAINALRAHDIGILRVLQVRNPYFTNDKERFEASPSFDFVLTHKQILTAVTPAVVGVEYGIHRV